jgi:septal ring factor EnvC (AmiA/AmiB activator)
VDWVLFVIKTVSKITFPLLLTLICLTTAGAENITGADREGEITARVLNVRSGPGKRYRIIGKLLKGARVVVIATEPEWLKISHRNVEGYVWRRHVHLAPIRSPENDALPSTATIEDMKPVTEAPPPSFRRITELEDESAPPPFDASMPPEDLERMKREADRIENQIAQHEAQVSAYTDKEAQLIDELDQLGRQLNRTTLQVKETRKEVALIEASLRETELEITSLEKEIAILDVYAAKRLVALYKLHRLGKMPVLASAESILDLLSRKNALERILSADKAVWNELTRKKGRAETLRNTLAEEERRYEQNIQMLGEQLTAMNRQSAARSKLLGEIRGKKSLMLAAVDSLKQAAFALDKRLDSNNWEIHPAGVSGVENKKPFHTLKGLLQPPVPGKITAFYGLTKSGELESANVRNGIDIEAETGEPIRAVSGGSIIYADWFRGYGNLIIIDHGNDYCTVYAHAEEIFKAEGDSVDPDEVIGTVGDTGSLAGTKLYFEIRHGSKPIDPLAWIKRK